ncbi:WD repeat protein [Penicillium brasilianum]|uniref:WD repeat protein n=1 Tax=Penicillium brasilianum TaxID=104259 RepID=A0A1S9R8G3_PENBI|nr:WD repeat protein [Penicillium brasilianum]
MRGDSNTGTTLPSSDLPRQSDYLSPPASRNGSCDTAGVSVHPRMNSNLSDVSSGRSAILDGDVAPALSMEVRRGSSASTLATTAGVMAAQEDLHLHNVGVAALAAVAHYPHAVNEESGSFIVNQVVNAVTDGPSSFHRGAGIMEVGGNTSEPSAGRLYSPLSGADSFPSASEDSSSGSETSESDLDMESIVHDLIERSATWQNIATITGQNDQAWKDMVMDYDSVPEEDHPSPSTVPDDDLNDLLRFYPDEEDYYHKYIAGDSPRETAMHDVNLDEFYQTISYEPTNPTPPQIPALAPEFPPAGPLPVDNPPEGEAEWHPASIIHTTTYERNLTIDEFIQRWMVHTNIIPHGFHSENRVPPQLRPLSKMMGWQQPLESHRPRGFQGRFYDLQQMPWAETLKVKRSDARALRDAWYTSYHNLDYSHNVLAERLPQDENFFQEKSMHTAHKATIEHFQLRNLMSVPGYHTVHFASRSKVFSWTPNLDDMRCLIDLTRPAPESGFLSPVKISSMKSAYGLTIAGGFCGEYALRGISGEGSGAKGLVTPDFNDGITNHVDIIRNRSGDSPICVFASNDRHLRVLDCETNIFLSDHELSRPINCTATSPDSRLRVVIGDSPDAWVIEADTGRPVHPLRGHRDFGFACAWSPDMRHIATSNQDKTVIIWDARTWRPLEAIDSDVAGYRSLRFSPVGGGPRTLLCAEPADRISIIDAQMYQSRQVHDFFGEIGGADYAPDGGSIWVANTDPHFGGFMRYERRNWGQAFGLADLPNEWLVDGELDGDERCLVGGRQRELRFLRTLDDEEYEMFML